MVAKTTNLFIFAFPLTDLVEAKDIVDVAVAAGNFKMLVQLLTDLDLVDTLRSQDAQTIFAPSVLSKVK